MRAIIVVPGWRVHVHDERADELAAKGWAVELSSGEELLLTEAGAVELLRLVDPEALRQIAARIEGGHF